MLFDAPGPKVFGIAPGHDVPAQVVEGLYQRTTNPVTLARTTIYANSDRMARRIRQCFQAKGSGLLPQIKLVTDLPFMGIPIRPVASGTLDIELTAMELIGRLIDSEKAFAPKHAVFDLAKALIRLFEEMQEEGVTNEDVAALNAPDDAGYWQQALAFVSLARSFVGSDAEKHLPAGIARSAAEELVSSWDNTPPKSPILVVGSTGSRGTTAFLMQAIARLPQGALILPGFDQNLPHDVWEKLTATAERPHRPKAEDHPQYRFARLCDMIGIGPKEVSEWTGATPPDPARNALVSLALRPAPITNAWLTKGPKLPNISNALENITWVTAPDSRIEALTIAMRLRAATETDQQAALITPDRTLARRVTAYLGRWDILPDDSAGIPLTFTPEGRLTLHALDWALNDRTCDQLIALLKHPLVHQHTDRGPHLKNTRDLEIYIRRFGKSTLTRADLDEAVPTESSSAWRDWVDETLLKAEPSVFGSLSQQANALRNLILALAGGAETFGKEDGGQKILSLFEDIEQTQAASRPFSVHDFAAIMRGLMGGESVRRTLEPHPNILIWGTLEARVQGADLVIMAGLNEGSWPEALQPDPWLSRPLRVQAGLALPERQIGLSAHDFQHGMGAAEVWITRSARVDGTETIPSRWVNRIENLANGLIQQGGKSALDQAKARGNIWVAKASAWEKAAPIEKSPRPSVVPPPSARIDRLSVTDVQTLIRNPYEIYAKRVLHLKELRGFEQIPNAGLRGQIVHDVLAEFMKGRFEDRADPLKDLQRLIETRLLEHVDHAPSALAWVGRLSPALSWFIDREKERQAGTPRSYIEIDGEVAFPAPPVTLSVRADRLDVMADGRVAIYDYKTGSVSTEKAQKLFDKQLLLEAMMVELGGFKGLLPAKVCTAQFLAIAPNSKAVNAPLGEEDTLSQFLALVARYQDGHPMTARRALLKQTDRSAFDHLSRYGEWTTGDAPMKVTVS